MPEARKIITDFTGGEVSDRILARVDREIYQRTLRTLENFIVHPSGGADFAPGTYFICEADAKNTFTKLADPATLPPAQGMDCAFSSDGVYMAVGHYTTPYVTIYKRSGEVFTKLTNPATLPTDTVNNCAFSADGVYLAVASDASPYVLIYKRSGDTFTKLANPATLPTGPGFDCAFSDDGVYLAVSHDVSPYITIYKRTADTFTKLADPATLPTGLGYSCAFSSDGVYLTVGHATTPFITLYKRTADVFAKLGDPATLPTGKGYGCAFSADGVYLAVADETAPFVLIYKRNADVFTKLANPATLPPDVGLGCAFSDDGVYLTIAHVTSPFITTYKRIGDIFTKLTDPATLPTGNACGCGFPSDGAYLAVGHQVTPFLTIYKRSAGPVRLLPFEKSSSEKYILELSEQTCRFYKNKARLMDGANPLEIMTPWIFTKLFGIQTAQQENKLYLTHGDYQLQALKSYGDLDWNLISADTDVCLAVGHATSPFITAYAYAADVFLKKANPDTLPTNTGEGCSFSIDGIYLAVAYSTSPYVNIYKRSGDTFIKLADPATLPAGLAHGCAFSPNGVYLAVVHATSPYVTIYKRSGDVFNKLGDPATLPGGLGMGCAFSADGVYLAVAHSGSPYLMIYKRSGDTFTKLDNPATLPGSDGKACSFSPDSMYLAIAHLLTPFVTIYKRSGDTFVKLTNPSTLPTNAAHGCAFSANGLYLAVAHDTSIFITIYKRSGDMFTKLVDPATLPTGNGEGCTFSPDSMYLAVAHLTSPFVTIYKCIGDTFTKIANPATLPTGGGYSCAFVPEGWQGVSWGSQYPRSLTFQDQRLIIGRDQTIRGSRTGWPQNFLLDAADSAAGFEYDLASDLLEEIIWLRTKSHSIVAGTTHGEWLLGGGDAPITGSNIYADRVSAHGNADICAILANESLLFVQTGGQRLREFMYSEERGGYISPDLTQLADHIGKKRFVDFAWQRSARGLLWTFNSAGELESLTLDRNSNILAWARYPRDGLVKSVAAVSGDEENPDGIVYLCVERVINGVTKQYIEYMKPISEPADEKDYFFVDCGKTFDYSATTDTMTGTTKAKPVVVTAVSHPFANDEQVRITGVVGMTELNGNIYCVKNKTTDTFQLYTADGSAQVDGTGYGTYVSGGLCEKVMKTLSGLDHLEAKTVAVYADGEALGTEVVSSGTITIDEYAAKIHVGLPYTGKIWTQRLGAFSQVRVPSATLLLYKSRGGKIGPNAAGLKSIRYQTEGPLTGPQEVRIGGRFSKDGSIMIVQDQPLPMTVLGIVADMSIGE